MRSSNVKFSTQLVNGLKEFMICEIDSRALSGITYTLLFKNEKDKDAYEKYKRVKQEALKCGYDSDEVFRVYNVPNGYIFDADISVVRKITAEILKAVAKTTSCTDKIAGMVSNDGNFATDIIMNNPDERRKNDLNKLANDIEDAVNKGKNNIVVALFSRNSGSKIVINGTSTDNKPLLVTYKAYALRHYDIERLNSEYLMQKGIRVSKLEPIEILPSKTGCSFKLTLEKI